MTKCELPKTREFQTIRPLSENDLITKSND